MNTKNIKLAFSLLGTGAALLGAGYALHKALEKPGERKHEQTPTAAEKRQLLETLLSTSDSAASAKAVKLTRSPFERYTAAPTVVGRFRLSGQLCARVCQFLPLESIVCLGAVCKRWNSFIADLKHDRDILRPHAVRGFRDGQNGRHRGEVWKLLSHADLALRKAGGLYRKLLARSGAEVDSIDKDVSRTLVHYSAFPDKESAERALSNVLNAFSVHDEVVGYCQGMNFVAGFLLTKLSEEDAYWVFYTIMHSPFYRLRDIFFPDLRGLLLVRHQFANLLQLFLPDLAQHFARNDVHSDVHVEMLMTLFSFSGFDKAAAARIWDLFFVDGYSAIHRVVLAILFRCQATLLELDFEGILTFLKAVEKDTKVLHPDELIRDALLFDVTPELLQRLERQYLRQRMAAESAVAALA